MCHLKEKKKKWVKISSVIQTYRSIRRAWISSSGALADISSSCLGKRGWESLWQEQQGRICIREEWRAEESPRGSEICGICWTHTSQEDNWRCQVCVCDYAAATLYSYYLLSVSLLIKIWWSVTKWGADTLGPQDLTFMACCVNSLTLSYRCSSWYNQLRLVVKSEWYAELWSCVFPFRQTRSWPELSLD